jgi:hypothetical protein
MRGRLENLRLEVCDPLIMDVVALAQTAGMMLGIATTPKVLRTCKPSGVAKKHCIS